MKWWVIGLCVVGIVAQELLVTKDYVDYLKRHVSWTVTDYEDNIFRGWTLQEARLLLGAILPHELSSVPILPPRAHLPAALSWKGGSCDHGVRNQGNCGSCWAFAVAGMLSDRCCLQGHDHGWLAPQELVSCDRQSDGCDGGWCTYALDYVQSVHGLVHEACFPYRATELQCVARCQDGQDWLKSHVCDCIGAYKQCLTIPGVKTCLQSGPVTVAFGVCSSFFNYKGGLYRCDCGGAYVGLHAVLAVGYSEVPECHYTVRNSWGTSWGEMGYFRIVCDQCGISGTYPTGNVMCLQVAP